MLAANYVGQAVLVEEAHLVALPQVEMTAATGELAAESSSAGQLTSDIVAAATGVAERDEFAVEMLPEERSLNLILAATAYKVEAERRPELKHGSKTKLAAQFATTGGFLAMVRTEPFDPALVFGRREAVDNSATGAPCDKSYGSVALKTVGSLGRWRYHTDLGCCPGSMQLDLTGGWRRNCQLLSPVDRRKIETEAGAGKLLAEPGKLLIETGHLRCNSSLPRYADWPSPVGLTGTCWMMPAGRVEGILRANAGCRC